MRKIESKQIMNLTLKENPEGYELMLGNQKLRYVEGYRIVKSSNQSGTAELTLKILVKFTQDDDSEKDIQRFVDDFIKMDSKEVGKLLGKGDEKKLRS